MNRRSMFRLMPIVPLVGATAVIASVKPKVEVRLPRIGQTNWGEIINKAIKDLQDEINKRG